MKTKACKPVLLALAAVVAACGQKHEEATRPAAARQAEGVLLKVGSITVTQADLDYQIKENHGGHTDEATRRQALDELAGRARLTQAALDADLEHDPQVRAEIARVLTNRLKEKSLLPGLQAAAAAPIPESRLRELYSAGESRFRSDEKRQVAVLWLNPGNDPQRVAIYQEKLGKARAWYSNNSDLGEHPEQGFSILSVDYSEHAASRYKGGVTGWLERDGGMDAWSKAVAEIAFSLKDVGEVSPVVARPEGVFLVRYMALKPAIRRPFESVSDELARAERQRLRRTAEEQFDSAIQQKYPVQWLK